MSESIEDSRTARSSMLLVSAAGDADRRPRRKPILTASVAPKAFGTQDYTITVVSGCSSTGAVATSTRPLYRMTFYTCCDDPFCGSYHYYTSLELPAGAVIDYIGVNSATPVDAALGFHASRARRRQRAHRRSRASRFRDTRSSAPTTPVCSASRFRRTPGITYVLDIEHPVDPTSSRYFGYVEIWWRRTVSDPPPRRRSPTFRASHPFYQFIEALAAPASPAVRRRQLLPGRPLTRGQMASS